IGPPSASQPRTAKPAGPSRNDQSSFFFQAEDGIRDGHVTGVQTCALPICDNLKLRTRARSAPANECPRAKRTPGAAPREDQDVRSEERRVGKEWRCRAAPERA